MTTGASPMCMSCARFDEASGGCEAYPDGIPEEILMGKWDHRVPQPGDHGLQYENDAGDPEYFESWWPVDGETPDEGGEA